MPKHRSLRAAPGTTINIDAARQAAEDALPARADKLQSESWAYLGDMTDPRGGAVLITALEVLRDDIDALEAALDTPPEGFEGQDAADGSVTWEFSSSDEGQQLLDRAERLNDFGLLRPAGLELF